MYMLLWTSRKTSTQKVKKPYYVSASFASRHVVGVLDHLPLPLCLYLYLYLYLYLPFFIGAWLSLKVVF